MSTAVVEPINVVIGDLSVTSKGLPIHELSDTQRIQYHLQYVEQELRKQSSDPNAIRENVLDVLKEYHERSIFPTNEVNQCRTPVFVDHYGVHCAVAHLMQETGRSDLVAQVNESHCLDYIDDITLLVLKFLIGRLVLDYLPLICDLSNLPTNL
jgi:hypothetical protein